MENYVPSRTCPCPRCKAQEILAPALLVAFGALFLLNNLQWCSFSRTWPVLLIVVGGVRALQTTASTFLHRAEAEPDLGVPSSAAVEGSHE